jgi:bifunctional non-homologous end joining protein LigD
MAKRVDIGRFEVVVSRPEKVLFPDAALTKDDLVRYSRRIADTMLPYLRHRPVTLQRYPDGIDDDGFYQQHRPDHLPDWVGQADLPKRSGGSMTHIVINGVASLVQVVNLGAITLHTWLSRVDRPDHPDRIVFDLDPARSDRFDAVRFAARRVRDLADEIGLSALVTTTGSRGLHVALPIRRELAFDSVRDAAQRMAATLADRHAERLTVEQRKEKRGDRVYLDVQRNAYGQHAVAPYSIRALPGAPVATPLDWSELGRRDLGPQRYSVSNIFRRLGQRNDPWRDAWSDPPSLKAAISKLENLRSRSDG